VARLYLDSGVLVKLYIVEPGSAWVQKQASAAGTLPLNPLQLAELTNAILAAGGRGMISREAVRRTLRNLDQDIQAGRMARETPEWSDVWRRVDQLAQEHTHKILCRTLDIIHVAIADITAADLFITGDRRQARLCRALGIRVREIPAA
jgi:predicted nucleic acid-binding protein